MFQRPDWRYLASLYPRRFDLDKFLTDFDRGEGHCSAIRRAYLRDRSIPKSHCFVRSPAQNQFAAVLPSNEYQRLDVLCRNQYLEQHGNLSQFEAVLPARTVGALNDVPVSWNLKELPKIGDEIFVKYVQHILGVENYPEFNYALKFKNAEALRTTFSLLGYLIYAGHSDEMIAKNWRVSVKRIAATRALFFDFSHYPKDAISQAAFLHYMRDNEIISEDEMMTYQRIYEMGELGLQAKYSYLRLPDAEQDRVKKYLKNSMISNTFRLGNAVRSSRDALNYSRAILDLERVDIERKNLEREEITTSLKLSQSRVKENGFLECDEFIMQQIKKRSLSPPKEIVVHSIADVKNS